MDCKEEPEDALEVNADSISPHKPGNDQVLSVQNKMLEDKRAQVAGEKEELIKFKDAWMDCL